MADDYHKEILNAGLALAMEFGENWLQPIQKRLHKKYKELTDEDLEEFNYICQKAMSYGHKLIYTLSAEEIKSKEAYSIWEKEYVQIYRWVSSENLSRLFSQSMYYAMK